MRSRKRILQLEARLDFVLARLRGVEYVLDAAKRKIRDLEDETCLIEGLVEHTEWATQRIATLQARINDHSHTVVRITEKP